MRGLVAGILAWVAFSLPAEAHDAPRDLRLMDFPKTASGGLILPVDLHTHSVFSDGSVWPGMAAGQLTDFVEPTQWPDWVERYRVQTQYRGFGRALRSTLMESQPVMNDSVYALAGATKVPTLLLWGEKDAMIPFANSADYLKAMPQIRLVAFPGVGHLPQEEAAAASLAPVREFLR